MQKTWDAIVVGAGPAGASCAVWLQHLGFKPLLLEASDRIGGLAARNPFGDIWTVTSPNQTGAQVAQQIAAQVQAAGVEVWLHAKVDEIRGSQPKFSVTVRRSQEQPQTLLTRFVVLATGVRPRELPGHEGTLCPGVIVGPGDAVMQTSFAGARVAILGGGDNAFENYEFVKSQGATHAKIFARSVRAQRQFVSRVPASDVLIGSAVVDPVGRRVNDQVYDYILVLYGWRPNIDFMGAQALTLDERGFVRTDLASAQTSTPGIFAIGEVAQRMHPCVPTAMADGVVAAKAIERELSKQTAA
jgi:thioredoxin reductase (NADPH)